jgi:methanogenic corrinoid protein MtbC1
MKRTLSPRDLASALGVSESSLKRWADRGAVRVTRTAGGHRRISVPDAIDFIRRSDLRLLRPELLGLSELPATGEDLPREGEESARLLEHLENGRSARARGLVLWMFLNGKSVAEICDGPLRHALRHLGETWADRPDGIFVEHRATDICVQALNQIRATREVEPEAPVAVGGAPSGDPYLLPSLMAATALTTEGFQAVNVGPDVPVQSLVEAARIHRPVFVWLSLTAAQPVDTLRDHVRRLGAQLQGLGVALLVGGRMAPALGVLDMTNLHRGESIAELVAFARGLAVSRADAERMP